MEKMFTPDEAAAELKIHPYTVRKILRTGELEGFQIGRHWRIPESALKAWIVEKTKATKASAKREERAG